jgi:hypothetical protein
MNAATIEERAHTDGGSGRAGPGWAGQGVLGYALEAVAAGGDRAPGGSTALLLRYAQGQVALQQLCGVRRSSLE